MQYLTDSDLLTTSGRLERRGSFRMTPDGGVTQQSFDMGMMPEQGSPGNFY